MARLLARGLTNKQIAAELVLSPATVRSHVEHILDKLDLRSRAQIAVWVSQQGLLPTDRTPYPNSTDAPSNAATRPTRHPRRQRARTYPR